MSIVAHLKNLKEKHAKLDASVAAEMARPMPDFALMTEMKKQKLVIKEEMLRLSSLLETADYQEAS